MNNIYLCKITDFQAHGNQIDVKKEIGESFFGFPSSFYAQHKNYTVAISYHTAPSDSEPIELQPANNLRFSTKLNSFLIDNCSSLDGDDIIVFHKLQRLFVARVVKKATPEYKVLSALFDDGDRHVLMTADTLKQPQDTTKVSSSYRQYITAIKSKPFLLLAGISGTGKSRIVRELARACWDVDSDEYKAHKPSNFEMVQVKPNWHDSSELIGYVSRVSGKSEYIAGPFLKFITRAWEDIETPYFLCLDEMNLAPVEQYFAEYLSVIESRKYNADSDSVITDPILESKEDWFRVLTAELTTDDELRQQFLDNGITIPQNLIVVGTVNMDETTFSFSRKVLDRAMTIEMNEVDLYGGLDKKHDAIGKLDGTHLIGRAVEGSDIYAAKKEKCDVALKYLKALNDKLEGTPFKIAYRTRNEFLLYVVNNLPYRLDDQDAIVSVALDEITSMKVLTRIEGDETKVSKKFLESIKQVMLDEIYVGKSMEEATKESVSLKKLDEMIARLDSGYTSFWS